MLQQTQQTMTHFVILNQWTSSQMIGSQNFSVLQWMYRPCELYMDSSLISFSTWSQTSQIKTGTDLLLLYCVLLGQESPYSSNLFARKDYVVVCPELKCLTAFLKEHSGVLDILIRRERSSLSDIFLCLNKLNKQTLYLWLNKQYHMVLLCLYVEDPATFSSKNSLFIHLLKKRNMSLYYYHIDIVNSKLAEFEFLIQNHIEHLGCKIRDFIDALLEKCYCYRSSRVTSRREMI